MQPIVWNRGWLALLLAVVLTGCGFQLRGSGNVPFDSMYVQDAGAPNITRDLKRTLTRTGVKLTERAEEAQLALELSHELSTKNILSLSGRGKVREYEILYQVTFRTRETGAELWGEPQTVNLRRDFSYSDSALLAKAAEESRLSADMQAEAVREVLRRVSSLSKGKAVAK